MVNLKEQYKNVVNEELIDYIEKNIFPEYEKNDKGHGLVHILEVVRRSFELKKSLNLNLDNNLIFTIACCHDNGKYIDHATHEKIAAKRFIENKNFKKFFNDDERKIIMEAIQDHRSSFSDTPRSDYGKLISSADRNSSIDIVFIRSFFVGIERTPDMLVDEFLDYTINRLRRRYCEESPENMFYEDDIYAKFLVEMRELLKHEDEFKKKYCKVNNIENTRCMLKDFKTL